MTIAGTRLAGRPEKGESVENWARRERYAALGRMAREAGATLVLLAHHRRDQAETVLLQALRGAGPAGLAAMPRAIVRDGLTWARPWLDKRHEDIEAYVQQHALPTVADPSNDDLRWARSRLRARVMPVLREAFEDADSALAAAARRAQEAREVLHEVARDDLSMLSHDGALALAGWRALSSARRRNALRAWLAAQLPTGVPESLVARLMDELADDASRRWSLDAQRMLRSWRGATAHRVEFSGSKRNPCAGAARGANCTSCDAESSRPAAGRGGCKCSPSNPAGSRRPGSRRSSCACVAGGEQFRRAVRGIDRSLKKQYQAAGVPSEGREGPLVYDAQGRLLYAPGLGVDARAWAPVDMPQWALRWIPTGGDGTPTADAA